MPNAEGIYNGGWEVQCRHEKSGATLIVDPMSGFSPTELCVTALCACTLMTMGYYGKKHNIDVSGTRFIVSEGYSYDRRRIESIDILFIMPDRSYTPEEKADIERVSQSCPVHNSFREDMKITMNFKWQ